jgi:hypothetical protein
MLAHRLAAGVDELLDHASDAVARNDWRLAQTFAEIVLRQVPDHSEAVLILRAASAYLETDHSPDPFSVSRDLRFMSIMFCDVVGSTRLARELGDAAWRDTIERFRRRCARAVRRYDGYIHEASGDELLILFGYPRVREDDARRAVLAGLDVIAAVAGLLCLVAARASVLLPLPRRHSYRQSADQGAPARGEHPERLTDLGRAGRRSRAYRETHRVGRPAGYRLGERRDPSDRRRVLRVRGSSCGGTASRAGGPRGGGGLRW